MVSFCEAVFLSFGAALKKLRCEQLVLNRFKKGIGNRANGEEIFNSTYSYGSHIYFDLSNRSCKKFGR